MCQLDRAKLFEKGHDRRNRSHTISHRLRGPERAGLTAPGPEDEQPGHASARDAAQRHGAGQRGRMSPVIAALADGRGVELLNGRT